MPRKYKKKLGSRRYINYSEETLQACLEEVKHKKISHREAEKKYKIPRSTIQNKLKDKHGKKPGKQPVFSRDEEKEFVNSVIALEEFGFPVKMNELQHIIKNYLNRSGREVKIFKDNFPGVDWVRGFLERHPQLAVQFAENAKRSRCTVNSLQKID